MTTLEDLIPAERSMPAASAARISYRIVRMADAAERPARRWRLGPRAALSSAALVLGTALAFVVVNLTTTNSAYAGWTPTPVAMPTHELSALGAECGKRVADAFPHAPAGMEPLLGERRGSSSLALIGTGSTVALCADWLGGRSGNLQLGNTLEGITTGARLEPGSNIELLAQPGTSGQQDKDALHIAYGLVAPNVDRVRILTEDGTRLDAYVSKGHFLGWWPTGAGVKSLTAMTNAGDVLGTMTPRSTSDQTPQHD